MIDLPRDPPPILRKDEIPDPEQLARLAAELLREAAESDPNIAQRARELGVEL